MGDPDPPGCWQTGWVVMTLYPSSVSRGPSGGGFGFPQELPRTSFISTSQREGEHVHLSPALSGAYPPALTISTPQEPFNLVNFFLVGAPCLCCFPAHTFLFLALHLKPHALFFFSYGFHLTVLEGYSWLYAQGFLLARSQGTNWDARD